jgi:flagellar basal body-associated protein FliL
VLLGVVVAVLLLAVVAYVVWLYRQGSFPASRTRKTAKRAARRSREMDREESKRE